MLLDTMETELAKMRDHTVEITLLGEDTPIEGHIKFRDEDGLMITTRSGANCAIPFHAIKKIMF